MKTKINLIQTVCFSIPSKKENISPLIYFKVSGKETIEAFKKGNKIHIKKKNRGSFTRWCGGNVTEECIKRGKNSSNPAIRKKATFADNSRHWGKS